MAPSLSFADIDSEITTLDDVVRLLAWKEIVHAPPPADLEVYRMESAYDARAFFNANGVGFVRSCCLYVWDGGVAVEPVAPTRDVVAHVDRIADLLEAANQPTPARA